MATVNQNRAETVRAELSGILGKLDALRARAGLALAARALFLSAWIWSITLLIFGGFVMTVAVPALVRGFLTVAHLAAIGAALWFGVIKPWRARRGRRVWAMYCEEHNRRLDKRLITTVDLAAEPQGAEIFANNPVANMLLRETTAAIRQFDPRLMIDTRQIRNPLLLAFVPLAVIGVVSLTSPDHMGRLFTSLYRINDPVPALIGGPAYTVAKIDVRPGNIEVARGATVTLQADFDIDHVDKLDAVPTATLYRVETDPVTEPMVKAEGDKPSYSLALHNVQENLQYQVALAARESPQFSINVYDPPAIEKITSTIIPPAYTRAAASQVEGRYIEALQGSEIVLMLQADTDLTKATLSDDESTFGGELSGTTATFHITVAKDRQLHVVIIDRHNHENSEPTTISIVSIEDNKPEVSVKRPGADWSVHPIGEVELRAEVTDDFGVQEFTFEYQINDKPAEQIALYTAPKDDPAAKKIAGEYALTLEDMGVQIGDVILYRFHATDSRPDAANALSSSQPYFLTIRPYEQRFLQGGGGEATGESIPPPPNQRQVIIATTRLIDESTQMESTELTSESKDVATTQVQIRQDTVRFLNSMRGRNDLPDRAERVAHIEKAMEAMEVAESYLSKTQPREALAPENAALSHLIAAAAGLPQTASTPSGGGGGAPRMDLLGQKLDTERNKFEAKSGLAPEVNQKLQEAIGRTRALAQRQKEFAETIRREKPEEGGGGNGQGSPQSSSSQNKPSSPSPNSSLREMVNREEMLQQLEEARRELERLEDDLLNLEGLSPKMTADLEQALRTAKSQIGRMANAIENNQMDQAEGANARALEKLNQLQLALEEAHQQTQTSPAEEMLAQISALREEQERLQSQTQNASRGSEANRRGLANRQRALSQDAQQHAENAATPGADGATSTMSTAAQNLRSSAATMERAANEVSGRNDDRAIASQSDAIAALDEATRALEALMQQANGQDVNDLELALAELRELKQALENPLATASNPEGRVAQTSEAGSAGNPSAAASSESSSSSPGEDARAGGGAGALSRIGRAPRSEPGGNDFSPSTSSSARFNAGQMRVQLKTIEHLLAPADIGTPLLRELSNLAASDMWNAPSGSGSGETEFSGEFLKLLNELEDILAEELASADQLHRLQQTPPEDLPERFRELGSRYFEALAEKRAADRANAKGN